MGLLRAREACIEPLVKIGIAGYMRAVRYLPFLLPAPLGIPRTTLKSDWGCAMVARPWTPTRRFSNGGQRWLKVP